MPADAHFYVPSEGHRLDHDPLNSIVAPRPIGWISTVGADGVFNLAPYSFFNLYSYRPPVVGFTSSGWKDSVGNATATGEFCWNLATRPLAEAMNASSAAVAADVDEFALAGLTAAESRVVGAPHVAESPVVFECRVTQHVQLTDLAGTGLPAWLTLGEVMGIHIAPELVASGVYDTVAAHPIARGGGPADYFELTEANRFRMPRPAGA
ncbi:MAG TPA: flavin reductase family protein [Ilumatobacter sp.]|nr:flavin reductase family protein [Ilumatobacter sp.]